MTCHKKRPRSDFFSQATLFTSLDSTDFRAVVTESGKNWRFGGTFECEIIHVQIPTTFLWRQTWNSVYDPDRVMWTGLTSFPSIMQSLVKEPFKVRRDLLQSSFNEIDGVSGHVTVTLWWHVVMWQSPYGAMWSCDNNCMWSCDDNCMVACDNNCMVACGHVTIMWL
jgi:hypothetical protein